MIIDGSYIRCPKCGWEADESCRWVCDVCNTKWNTFETNAKCPGCGKVFVDTQCMRSRGGCGYMSLNVDWYQPIAEAPPKEKEKFTWFWQKNEQPPITENDMIWVENNLLWFAELLTPEVFRSLHTITADKQYFDHDFKGTEADADFILQRVSSIMNIKPWEIQLMFFSDQPTRFTDGITATPSEKIKGGWSRKNSELVDNGYGNKEIWIEIEQLRDTVNLIATMSVELAKYKLTSEYAIEDDIHTLADFASLVFGFGIFRANGYFKFAQWTGNRYQGWRMQKRGGLPEPIIMYVMAWLAHYRQEDTSWKKHLNRTVRKYFEQSAAYIEKNASDMKWS
jgi:hypothetical protein